MKNLLVSASDFANAVKNTVYLVRNLWKEHTTLLIHAPQSVDKTAKALDIIEEVSAAGRKVVYINTASSLDAHAERVAAIDGLAVFTPAYDSPDDTRDYADLVIASIEEIVAETGIRTFTIDSVSRIAALSFGRNASAAYVMKRLVALPLRLRLSLMIIAHDTTKSTDRALLTLADTGLTITPADQSDQSDQSDSSEPAKSDSSEPSEPSEPGHPRRRLSRRDRRILRRQAKFQKP